MVKRIRKRPDRAYAPRAEKTGRPPAAEGDVRSARLAQRVHPDLLEVYDQRAREYGLTRSQLIERVLVEHANAIEGAQLDSIGRWLTGEAWGLFRWMRKNTKPPISDVPLEIGLRKQAEYKVVSEAIEAEKQAQDEAQGRYADERYERSLKPRKK